VLADRFGQPTETYSFCDWSRSIPYYATLGGINFLLLVYALYVAWLTRDISTEFAESEYIFKAMVLIFVVCLIGIPVTILARENAEAFFYVCSFIIFASSTSILLLIFCPKLLAFHSKKMSRRSQSSSTVPQNFRRSNSSSGNFRWDFKRSSDTTSDRYGTGSSGEPGDSARHRGSDGAEGIRILGDRRSQIEHDTLIAQLQIENEGLKAENERLLKGRPKSEETLSGMDETAAMPKNSDERPDNDNAADEVSGNDHKEAEPERNGSKDDTTPDEAEDREAAPERISELTDA